MGGFFDADFTHHVAERRALRAGRVLAKVAFKPMLTPSICSTALSGEASCRKLHEAFGSVNCRFNQDFAPTVSRRK
jgi:hypothetical protein